MKSDLSPRSGRQLPPRFAGFVALLFAILGLTPQALRCCLLRRLDTTSNIPLVVFDSISFQEQNELVPERHLLMVLFLARNISLNLLQV